MNIANLSRRRFLQTSSVFVVGAAVPGCSVGPMPSPDATLEPNVFLSMAGDGTVTITASRSEMGQGIRTALAQIVADELEADWSRVTVAQAVGDPVYGDQNTDGSQSIRFLFDTLRNAGASAREMLRMAAANQWGVPVAETEAADHSVTHAASGRSLAYGDLVAAASELPVPENPPFKTRDAYRYIGKTRIHVDANDVADGRATFGLDVTLPDMAHAVVVRAAVPRLGRRELRTAGRRTGFDRCRNAARRERARRHVQPGRWGRDRRGPDLDCDPDRPGPRGAVDGRSQRRVRQCGVHPSTAREGADRRGTPVRRR